MSHRVAMYTVRIRPKREPDAWKPLGDIDAAGTWLGDVIDKGLTDLHGVSRDGKVEARSERVLPDLGPSQVGAAIVSGRSGIVSRIEKAGEKPFLRTSDHMETMRSAVLFDLPRSRDSGRMAIHVPHGHGCKAIIDDSLNEIVGGEGFKLDLRPVVPQNALLEAVERHGVELVTLIKYDPLGSDAFYDAAMWGNEEVGRLELSIPSKRNRRLRGDPVLRFLEAPTDENRRRLVEFQGLRFDDVAVTVQLLDGSRRRFHLEPRERGHPMTVGITIGSADTDELGATAAALAREIATCSRVSEPVRSIGA